ncbi:glycosyltransferase [bacterium]|nr:glycosyltransferase [bacterium]
MKFSMTISVVIPAYRAARTIRRAIDSVLHQHLQPNEILVVDDGSPDRAELIAALQSYGQAVTRLEQKNGGVASARNRGVEQATGDWIAFLDADDYWEPEKLARQAAIAEVYPEVSLIGCRWYNQVPGGQQIPDRAKTADYAGRVLKTQGPAAFQLATCVWTGSLMIRRSVLLKDRFVSELEPAEDRDLWFRLLNQYAAYICPELLATYVQEPGGISRSNIDRDCQRMLRMICRHQAELGSGPSLKQMAIVYRRWAAEHLGAGLPRSAFRPACQRLRLEPWRPQAWWIVCKSACLASLPSRLAHHTHMNASPHETA